MKAFVSAVALSLVVASFASDASAAVAYSNFGSGPGDTYDTGAGIGITSSGSGRYCALAIPFESAVTGTVDSYDIPGWRSYGGSVTLNLLEDAEGVPSSNTLDSVSLSFPDSSSVITQLSGSHPQLVAGQTYWLVLKPTDAASDSEADWNINNLGLMGPDYYDDGSGWMQGMSITPAFSVQASVPEPTTLGLLAIPAFLALRRRKPQQA